MSGINFMSDSWIAWNPRIDEPSNIWPSVKNVASAVSAGTLKCCITPGRSQNRTSTNLTPSFLMKAMTSSAELNIRVSLIVGSDLLAGARLATLAVFGVSTAVLVALLGHTIGHRLVGVGVVRLRDVAGDVAGAGAARQRPPGLVAAVVRTVLLCLVIPAAVWDGDGRGLHDVAAGTVIVRR